MSPYTTFSKQAAELLKHPHLQPYVLQLHLKSHLSRSIVLVHQSPSEKRMTFAAEPVCRSKGRRNSLGSERMIAAFSKPSPDRSSVSSIRSVKDDYTATQSVRELSVDESMVEVASKPVASRTSDVMRTPKVTPWKMMATLRNRLEAPQASYDRTSHTEVYVIACCYIRFSFFCVPKKNVASCDKYWRTKLVFCVNRI
jgi:NIMA (never in mitosis gene a)-related kinase 1/4/5